MALAATPALILIPALLLLPEPERGASEIHPPTLSRGSMWSILRIPTLWWIIASGALLNFSMYAIATFLPAFLSRIHGLSLGSSGIASGFVYLSGGLAGCITAGYLGDSSFTAEKMAGCALRLSPLLRPHLSHVSECCSRAARCSSR